MGDWCLMGAGCWNHNGEIPAHPSAHCKAYLGWVDVETLSGKGSFVLEDVKWSRKVIEIKGLRKYRYERFLLEYREPIAKTYDECIPGGGLLIWHIDMNENVAQENNEHRRVSLEQADGKSHLSTVKNHFGDQGDPFPGSEKNTEFSEQTKPNSRHYRGDDSLVRISNILVENGCVKFNYDTA